MCSSDLREAERLQALPAERRAEAFFACWTRKEGYIKARGDGIYCGLDRFEVEFVSGEAPSILWSADDPHAPSRWDVSNVDGVRGWSAAVVAERAGGAMRRFKFNFD